MTSAHDEQILSQCFQEVTSQAPTSITPLRPHASERRMYRLTAGATSLIGVINANRAENDAFIYFCRHFASLDIPVPAISLYRPAEHVYLEEDLGDETLFDFLGKQREISGQEFPESAESVYRLSLEYLPQFQIKAASTIDFSRCYPEVELLPGTFAGDCASFARDLVARVLPQFNTTALTSDFATLIAFLDEAPAGYFVYRDFQSRNIMCVDTKPVFIDFQGGRRGALQYDVVSLLYQASTKVPYEARQRLIQHFCTAATQFTPLDVEVFQRFLSGFVIARMLQVLGVYGRQGLVAGKAYFANSIPIAVTTLAQELDDPTLPIRLPQLRACAHELCNAMTSPEQV